MKDGFKGSSQRDCSGEWCYDETPSLRPIQPILARFSGTPWNCLTG